MNTATPRADGTYAEVLDRGYVLRDAADRAYRMLGSIQDITERKQALAAVIRERDFSDAVLNSLPGIFYLFDEAGKFIRWNTRFAQVSATWTPRSPTCPARFLRRQGARADPGAHWRGLHQGLSDAEANFVTKSHSPSLLFTGSLIIVDGRRCLIGVGTDVTEKRKLQEQFLRAQRLEGIGMLAAGIAHDLNNVLTPILMRPHAARPRHRPPRPAPAPDPGAQRGAGRRARAADPRLRPRQPPASPA